MAVSTKSRPSKAPARRAARSIVLVPRTVTCLPALRSERTGAAAESADRAFALVEDAQELASDLAGRADDADGVTHEDP